MAETVKATRKRKPGRPPKAATGATAANDLPAKDDLVAMYRDMLLIRRFEEKAGQLYGMGQIGGFCHLYIGQEAVVVGLQSVSKPGDTVVTSYRDHGHMLACGMDADGVMAELTGLFLEPPDQQHVAVHGDKVVPRRQIIRCRRAGGGLWRPTGLALACCFYRFGHGAPSACKAMMVGMLVEPHA